MAEQNLHDMVGWPVVHQFFRIDRARWRSLTSEPVAPRSTSSPSCCAPPAARRACSSSRIAGIAKSDFGYMAVHPELARLQQLGQQLAATAFGTCLTPVYAFLSACRK